MPTLTQHIQHARTTLAPIVGDLDVAALEARMLAQHAWSMTPEQMLRDANIVVTHDAAAQLQVLVDKRVQRQPIAQIMGYTHFWRDRFLVTTDVLTPRSDSETLIAAARRLRPRVDSILDLGTGSGCLLLSLLGEYEEARGVGVDISPAALAVAVHNAQALGRADRCDFICGSWCETLDIAARFAMVVANPPYIAARDIGHLMQDVRDYEPHLALDGGADGLDCYRMILATVAMHMQPGGLLLLEVGAGQAACVATLGQAQGFLLREIVQDYHRIDRVVVLENTQEDTVL